MKKVILSLSLSTLTLFGCAGSNDSGLTMTSSTANVVGGSAANLQDLGVASTVSLHGPDKNIFCSGTLISSKTILTAAHCVATRNAKTLFIGFAAIPTKLFEIDSIRIEPGFVNADFSVEDGLFHMTAQSKNDLAVLHLKTHAPSVAFPALLPSKRLPVGSHAMLRLFGYGKTSASDNSPLSLHWADMLGSVEATAADKVLYDQTSGRGVCYGDSGGPSYNFRKNRATVVAVSSNLTNIKRVFGKTIGDACKNEGYVTQVGPHLRWIKRASRIMEKEVAWKASLAADAKSANCFDRPNFREDFRNVITSNLELAQPFKLLSRRLVENGEEKSWKYKVSGQDVNGKKTKATFSARFDNPCELIPQ